MPVIGDVQILRGSRLRGLLDTKLEGLVFNNVRHILSLEYGSSSQAPNGMLRLNIDRIQALAREEVAHALRTNEDPENAIAQALAGTLEGAKAILARATPVDTGQARNGWQSVGPYKRTD